LPNFDDTVIQILKTNEPELVWNMMLRQAAAYYYARWLDTEDAGIYRIIDIYLPLTPSHHYVTETTNISS